MVDEPEPTMAFRLTAFHVDSDGGGMSDYEELLRGDNPNELSDTDEDGIPDEFEKAWLGSLDYGADSDSDNDGILLYDEWRYKLDVHRNDLEAGKRTLVYDYDRLISDGASVSFTFDQAGNITIVGDRK